MENVNNLGSNISQIAAHENGYVIRYLDGAYNYGPHGSPKNGFPVLFAEASIYPDVAAAAAKLEDLQAPDASYAKIVPWKEAYVERSEFGVNLA